MRRLPIVLAYLLLGAHFLRAGLLALTVACILAPLLLLIHRRWALIALQAGAYLGALIWLYTTIRLVQWRQATAQPWGRMLLILLVVTFFTVAAGLLLNSGKLKARYPTRSPES